MHTVPRLYFNPGKWEFRYNHYTQYYDGQFYTRYVAKGHPDVRGIRIMHDDRIRPEWRNLAMQEYQAVQAD